MNEVSNQSPVPVLDVGMSLPKALEKVMEGKAITKLEWNNINIYIILKNNYLMLHKEDNKLYNWIISEADLQGLDYVLCNESLVKIN